MKTRADTPTDYEALSDVRRWVEEFVIGEGLCPFARASFQRTSFVICKGDELISLITVFQEALNDILQPEPLGPESTLIITPKMLDSFDSYLEALDILNEGLAQSQLEGIIQIASFHPEYCFEDTDASALSNYTNRAPWPIFHLLKESSVTQAIEGFPNVENIPTRNIAHLEALGDDRVRFLCRRHLQGSEKHQGS